MKLIDMRPWADAGTTWLVWEPEQGGTQEDAREVRATSAQQAAEDYAAWADSRGADYTIVTSGSAATYHVREESGGPEQRFVVTGEIVPQYTARALP